MSNLVVRALHIRIEMIDMETDRRLDVGETPPIKIVAGNKCDLQGARQIKSQQGLEWARRKRCGFMETSAREMVNIEETFAREPTTRLPPALRHEDVCWWLT